MRRLFFSNEAKRLYSNMNLSKVRGLFAGSGSDALNNPEVTQRVIELTNKPPTDCCLLYIGTATYDSMAAMEKQTVCFKNSGVSVVALECTLKTPSVNEIEELTRKADIILVSGGNTLYAYDRWMQLNLRPHLIEAANRGCVLTGGSAGAICWFTAGHSDSMDPSSYRQDNIPKSTDSNQEEIFKSWKYIRVPCLNLFDGLVCPHYDKVQSNGILRALDFDEMMKRHSNERGICIDHWCSLVFPGDGTFEIFSPQDKLGSVTEDGDFSEDRKGVPGLWIKDVLDDDIVQTKLIGINGTKGVIGELCRPPSNGTSVVEDSLLSKARALNPIAF